MIERNDRLFLDVNIGITHLLHLGTRWVFCKLTNLLC